MLIWELGKKQRATLSNPDATDSDGFLQDIDIQSIAEDTTKSRDDCTQDIKEFFHPTFEKIINGKSKKYHICKKCLYVLLQSTWCK